MLTAYIVFSAGYWYILINDAFDNVLCEGLETKKIALFWSGYFGISIIEV